MKKVKAVKKFIIYELNEKEKSTYGFSFAPVLKETVECYGNINPSDTDWECETLEEAISWAVNY